MALHASRDGDDVSSQFLGEVASLKRALRQNHIVLGQSKKRVRRQTGERLRPASAAKSRLLAFRAAPFDRMPERIAQRVHPGCDRSRDSFSSLGLP